MTNIFKVTLITSIFSIASFSEARHDFYMNIVSVDKILHTSTHEIQIEIFPNTFLHNIQGYACPLPGIQLDKLFFSGAALEHRETFEFGVEGDNQALIVNKKSQKDFCNFPDNAQEIFGDNFIVGSMHRINLTLVRSIVTIEDFEGKREKILLEKFSSNLLGVEIQSTASVSLEKEIPIN